MRQTSRRRAVFSSVLLLCGVSPGLSASITAQTYSSTDEAATAEHYYSSRVKKTSILESAGEENVLAHPQPSICVARRVCLDSLCSHAPSDLVYSHKHARTALASSE